MKKLNVAIIGQGRSGKNIHGAFFVSERNTHYNVRYVVDFDPFRCDVAKTMYPGCETFTDYRALFDKTDIDLIVNATYSDLHVPVTKDCLEHGFNVLVEKPFARNQYEAEMLIRTAKKYNVLLAVFQQSFYTPYYMAACDLIESGTLGEIRQISIHFNGFARRWDWQTMQRKLGGNVYNTGPHPIGFACGFLDFDPNIRVLYSKLASSDLVSGDAEDYAKILLTAPNKPVIDVEISSHDAYSDYNLKIQGTRGTFKCTPGSYQYKYIVLEEHEPRPLIEESLKNEKGEPIYCGEKLNFHEEKGTYSGDGFNIAPQRLYDEIYFAITEGKPLTVTAEKVVSIVSVMETVHAMNPLPVKY